MKKIIILMLMVCIPAIADVKYLEVNLDEVPFQIARFDALITITPETLHYTQAIYGTATYTTAMIPLREDAFKLLSVEELESLHDSIASWIPPLPFGGTK